LRFLSAATSEGSLKFMACGDHPELIGRTPAIPIFFLGGSMTQDEAVARWRLLSREEVESEKENNLEFREALAGAVASGRKFWEVDAGNWHKKQYTVDVAPARPQNCDPFCQGEDEKRVEKRKPTPGAAFPS
jgi:hypothetical protein